MYKIPFHKYRLSIEEEKAVLRVLRSGWLTFGNEVLAFEKEFSNFIGDDVNAVAVSSCTSALYLTLGAMNFPKNSEVILPAFTYVSDVLSIIHLGLVPVLADISLDDYCVNPLDIERKITYNTKAIVIVHYAGNPCEIKDIKAICNRYNLTLIEDCAHAIETKYYGKSVGVFGDASVYSFYPNKNITTAEGGMIVSKDVELIDKCKRLRNHGIDIDSVTQSEKFTLRNYDILEPGYKFIMSDLQAAIGRVQLRSIQSMLAKRVKVFNLYKELLCPERVKIIANYNENVQCSHHFLPIEVAENKRDKLVANLLENGVQPSLHFKPIHKFSFAQNFSWSIAQLPNTETAYKRQLSLPLYPMMELDDVKYVCDIVNASL